MNERRDNLADVRENMWELAHPPGDPVVGRVDVNLGAAMLRIISSIERLDERLQTLEQKAPPSVVG